MLTIGELADEQAAARELGTGAWTFLLNGIRAPRTANALIVDYAADVELIAIDPNTLE